MINSSNTLLVTAAGLSGHFLYAGVGAIDGERDR